MTPAEVPDELVQAARNALMVNVPEYQVRLLDAAVLPVHEAFVRAEVADGPIGPTCGHAIYFAAGLPAGWDDLADWEKGIYIAGECEKATNALLQARRIPVTSEDSTTPADGQPALSGDTPDGAAR